MFDYAVVRRVSAVGITVLILWGAAPAHAQLFGKGKQHAKVTLVSSVKQVVPGRAFDVGVRFALKDGWHIYWKNGGDAGVPPKISWALPEGFTAAEPRFPAPRRHIDPGGVSSNIHEGEPVLLVRMTPPATIAGRRVELVASGRYLICKDKCIFENIDAKISLPVAVDGAEPEPANEAVFSAARRALPRTSSKYVTITPSITTTELTEGTKFELVVGVAIKAKHHIQSHSPTQKSLIKCDLFVGPTPDVYFDQVVYPEGHIRTVPVLGKLSEYSGRIEIRVPAEMDATAEDGKASFGGVLRFQVCSDKGQCYPPEAVSFSLMVGGPAVGPSGAQGLPAPATKVGGTTGEARGDAVPVKKGGSSGVGSPPRSSGSAGVSRTSSSESVEASLGWFGLAGLLVACFLYGLIINATPCVLPLLSIKVLGFARQAHESRRRTLMLGLAFGAGVMIFFVLLGFLAASGKNILQFPAAVIALCAVVMAMALSMLGVFSLQLPAAAGQLEAGITQEGMWASFGKGALAPVLGFACTGPLLASAFAWATQQPPHIAVFAFLSAGLGMASPYMLLGANPKWLSFLPKPGNWMITFERIMGFLLMLMVLWLLHPLIPQIGSEGLEWTLGFFVMVAMGCWVLGKVDITMSPARRWKYRGGATGLVVVSGLLVYGWIYPLDEAIARQRELAEIKTHGAVVDWGRDIPWRRWSGDAVEREVRAGRAVFVDFTAAWCTVCKANKKLATNTSEVRSKMKSCGMIPFKADFTSEDPVIAAALQTHGRVGPPLNLVYLPGRPEQPIVLTPNLTKDYLLAKLDEACTSKVASANE